MKLYLLLALPQLLSQLASAQSAVPGAISYQGRVADAAGVLIGDTSPVNRKVTLRIYDQSASTTPLYAEEQTVTINKGVFSVLLGQGLQVGSEPRPAIANVFNGAERFLGVTVDDGGAAPDPEITPRQQIVSTAYAFRAKQAENASSVTQQSGESTFNTTHTNLGYFNGTLTMNGDAQIQLGGGSGSAQGALFSNSGGVGLYGRGPTDAERRLVISAKGGTFMDGPLNFGTRTAQHINLWSNTFGIGIQSGTLYNRTEGHFAWYRGGVHADGELDAGTGQNLAVLNGNGLTVNTGNVRMQSGGRFVGSVGLDGHGVFAGSFSDGHSFGSQDWTTYSRSARNFAWYLGGAWNGGELNAGGGTRIAVMDGGAIRLQGSGGGGTGIELGYGTAKEVNNGTISYQRFSDGLDIVGAGDSVPNRRIKFYAQGGTQHFGSFDIADGQLNVTGNINSTGGNVEGNDLRARSWVFCNNIAFKNNSGGYRWETKAPTDYEFVFDGSTRYRIDGNGNTFKGSDRALKKEIMPITAAIGNVMKLKPTTYQFKKDAGNTPRSYGFIAQELQEVYPEMVGKSSDGLLSVSYESLIPVAISAIQEQQKLIESKDAQIAVLTRELAAAKQANTLQDTRLAAIEKALKLESASAAPAEKDKETKVASRR